MILPDVNVLVHAHNADSAVHDQARRWWDTCLSGVEGVGLAWATMLGFVRITTNRKVVARPLPVQDVMRRLQDWLALPHFHVAQPSESHFARLRGQLERLGTAGNLTTDAHLAVLAIERELSSIRPILISPGFPVFAGSIRANSRAGRWLGAHPLRLQATPK
jgi:toxin-antitoxin system PIN domain toxin